MADKDTEEELARKKRAEAEIFGKTLGFTHTPSPEELERTVVLKPAAHSAPAPQDFESTVRFSNFDALVDSDTSSGNKSAGHASTPPAPEAPKAPAKAATAKQKPVAPEVKAAKKASPAKAPVAKAPAPAPKAAPAPTAGKQPPAAAVSSPPAPPAAELDLSAHDFGLGDAELEVDSTPAATAEAALETIPEPTPEPVSKPAPEATPRAEFDSGAALDELDELLKMDIPEIETSPVAEQPESGLEAESMPDMAIPELDKENNDLDQTIDSMLAVQLSAADLAEDDKLLALIDEDEPIIPAKKTSAADDTEQDDIFDLSSLEASLDTDPAEEFEDKPAETQATEPSAEPAPGKPETSAKTEMEEDVSETVTAPSKSETIVPAAATPMQATEQKRGGSGFAIFLSLLALAAAGASYWFSQGAQTTPIQAELTQVIDRLSQLEAENHNLATQMQTLQQKNEKLEQRLNDLKNVVANRAKAGKKKALRRKQPLIQASTPVKSATKPAPKPVIKPKGWVINLTSVSSSESAKQELARLKSMGVDAQAIRTEARGKIWYRIRVSGFATFEEAEAQGKLLGEKLNISDIWVGKP